MEILVCRTVLTLVLPWLSVKNVFLLSRNNQIFYLELNINTDTVEILKFFHC